MNAGILTLHKADNYGAVLQAYGLQGALAGMGIDSELIEFCEPAAKEPASAAAKGGPAAFAERVRAAGAQRAQLFDEFRKKRLRCSQLVPPEQAGTLNDRYDVFVAGSDQIWNAQLPEVDGRYLLPFAAPDKRVSYAASFGTDSVPDKLNSWYAQQLSAFRALSVREEQGRELIRVLTGRDCAVCLDPVFLLDRADWERLADTYSGPPYLFLYMVGYDGQLASRAKSEAERLGVELRTATAGFVPQCGVQAWNGAGVERWLSLILNAAGVFTNSFHAAAFALMFSRPLSVAPLKDSLSRRNGRLEELLHLTGMERCINGELTAVSEHIFLERLHGRKQASFDYLSGALLGKNAC